MRVAGVLFNRVKSEGHYRLLRDAVTSATDLEVVGYLEPDSTVTIADRHLGLRTAIEEGRRVSARLAESAARTTDLDQVVSLAGSVEDLILPDEPVPGTSTNQQPTVRVGVAYDPAFCFTIRIT